MNKQVKNFFCRLVNIELDELSKPTQLETAMRDARTEQEREEREEIRRLMSGYHG